jgi:PAS domain S-box-containing protein
MDPTGQGGAGVVQDADLEGISAMADDAVTESDLRTAHDVARLASWEWTAATNEVVIFHALPESSLTAGASFDLEEMIGLVPPSERERLRSELAAITQGTGPSVSRFRYELPSGDAWLENRCEAVRDDTGAVIAVRGTTQDVTREEREARELIGARTFLQATLDSIPHSIAVLGREGEILLTNRAWGQFADENGGFDEARAGNYLEACDAAAGDPWADEAGAGLRAVLADPASPEFTMEYPCHSPGGERWFELRASRYEGPGDAAAVLTHMDVTSRHGAEQQTRFQASLVDAANASVVATDGEGRITHWSRGAQDLYGWTAAEAIGRKLGELILPSEFPPLFELDTEGESDGRSEEYLLVSRKDGSSFPAYVRASPAAGTAADGASSGRIFVSMDITDSVAAREALLRARHHLRAVTDSMAEGLFTLDDDGRVTYMNQATERLLGWSRHEVIGRKWEEVARAGGQDEEERASWAALTAGAQGAHGVIKANDTRFMHKRGFELPVAYTASPLEVVDGAGGCVVVFTDISERKARERDLLAEHGRREVTERISSALADDRFRLYGQPIIDLRTGAVTQNELLLRMVEPGGEVAAPGTFLKVAEDSGLIRDIDRWVIGEGLKIAAAGHGVQINVSARSIGDLMVMEHIEDCLAHYDPEPGTVIFEMTETAILADPVAAVAFAERLHELGCKLALDDFGTGYGSFTYLKRLPVDYLKIDIDFVSDVTTNASSRHVVSAIVSLARAFGLQTIGEGVEDAETKRALLMLGVDYAQGYVIAHPQPIQQIFGDLLTPAA